MILYIFVFLCLTYFTRHSTLQVHLCYCKLQISFFLAKQYSSVCVCVCVTSLSIHGYLWLLMYPFMDTYWSNYGCSISWLLQTVLLWTLGWIYPFELRFLFSDIYPGVELLDMLVLFLVFWETSMLLSTVMHQFTFPPTVYRGFLFSISSLTLDDSHSFWW